MSVLNPRNRLVNFRLSEAEFEQLRAACQENGARSVSEFARTAVLGSLENGAPQNRASPERLEHLEGKVSELEVRIEQLLRLLSLCGIGSGELTTGAEPAGSRVRS